MSYFYLTQYTGTGSDEDPVHPIGSERATQGWSGLDIGRGYCVMAVPEQLADETDLELITTDLIASLPQGIRNKVSQALGVSITESTLSEIMVALFTHKAAPEDGRRPIKGNQLWLGNQNLME